MSELNLWGHSFIFFISHLMDRLGTEHGRIISAIAEAGRKNCSSALGKRPRDEARGASQTMELPLVADMMGGVGKIVV